jgi:predicted transcriptional regulator
MKRGFLIYLDDDLKKVVKKMARKENRSTSNFIIKIISDHINLNCKHQKQDGRK